MGPAKRTRLSARPKAFSDPVVDQFVRHDPDPAVTLSWIRAFPEPHSAKLRALALSAEVSAGLRPARDADLAEFELAYYEKSAVGLHLLFLIGWVRLLFF